MRKSDGERSDDDIRLRPDKDCCTSLVCLRTIKVVGEYESVHGIRNRSIDEN